MPSPVVMDTGTDMIKAGFAGDDAPRVIIPCVLGRVRYQFGQYKYHFGNEALAKRSVLRLDYPVSLGVVHNFDKLEKIWEHTLCSELSVSPEDQPMLLTETDSIPKSSRERKAQIMFETFRTPSLSIASEGALCLHSYGRTIGLVLASGAGKTMAVPVFEGKAINDAVLRFDMNGAALSSNMAKLLGEENVPVDTTIGQDIKETLCYVAGDLEQELKSASTVDYELPNDTILKIKKSRFLCAEAVFKPSLVGADFDGIHHTIHNSIMKCPEDIRKAMFANIILSGGNTMFPGFGDRLKKELDALCDPGTVVNVTGSGEQQYAAWKGASMLASAPDTLQKMSVTKQQYEEFGASIIHKIDQ